MNFLTSSSERMPASEPDFRIPAEKPQEKFGLPGYAQSVGGKTCSR